MRVLYVEHQTNCQYVGRYVHGYISNHTLPCFTLRRRSTWNWLTAAVHIRRSTADIEGAPFYPCTCWLSHAHYLRKQMLPSVKSRCRLTASIVKWMIKTTDSGGAPDGDSFHLEYCNDVLFIVHKIPESIRHTRCR